MNNWLVDIFKFCLKWTSDSPKEYRGAPAFTIEVCWFLQKANFHFVILSVCLLPTSLPLHFPPSSPLMSQLLSLSLWFFSLPHIAIIFNSDHSKLFLFNSKDWLKLDSGKRKCETLTRTLSQIMVFSLWIVPISMTISFRVSHKSFTKFSSLSQTRLANLPPSSVTRWRKFFRYDCHVIVTWLNGIKYYWLSLWYNTVRVNYSASTKSVNNLSHFVQTLSRWNIYHKCYRSNFRTMVL